MFGVPTSKPWCTACNTPMNLSQFQNWSRPIWENDSGDVYRSQRLKAFAFAVVAFSRAGSALYKTQVACQRCPWRKCTAPSNMPKDTKHHPQIPQIIKYHRPKFFENMIRIFRLAPIDGFSDVSVAGSLFDCLKWRWAVPGPVRWPLVNSGVDQHLFQGINGRPGWISLHLSYTKVKVDTQQICERKAPSTFIREDMLDTIYSFQIPTHWFTDSPANFPSSYTVTPLRVFAKCQRQISNTILSLESRNWFSVGSHSTKGIWFWWIHENDHEALTQLEGFMNLIRHNGNLAYKTRRT